MKRISHRMLFLIILMVLLMAGLSFFMIRFFVCGQDWVTFPGSPHVYQGQNLTSGIVTDRGGTLLLDSTDGRVYGEDPELRRATMHLLGDRYGYIPTPVLNAYADKLVGYSPVNGLYSLAAGGSRAKLTVSAQVQKTAQAALAGRKGTIGVYNYKTGEILCAVTSPTYDPDAMPDVEGDVTGQYDGVYVHRFFRTAYTPGSIFKVLTAAAALEKIPDAATRTFSCSGSWDCEGDTIRCNGVHGYLNLQQALGSSCNVVFGQLAVELGRETMMEYAERYGINQSLTFDGLETAAGQYDVSGAVNSQLAWSGIGQYTDLVNACQYMTFMGAVANNGEAAVPHIMEEIHALRPVYRADTTMMHFGIDPEVCHTLGEMMHQAVVNNYGAWHFPDLNVCAKSGTAEQGEGTTPHATFAGFIRDAEYPLAFIVIIEHGGSGSAACAPVAGQVLKACVAELDRERG